MALTILGQTTSKGRYGNGAVVPVTGTRDGAINVQDWIQAAAIEGRLFTAELGTAATKVAFGAYDADQPEIALGVPTGTTIIPVHITVAIETMAGTANQVIALTSTSTVTVGTSTAITPLSNRTSRPVTSACTVYGAYSGNGTTPAGTQEFWRAGYPVAAAAGVPATFEWDIRTHIPVVIDGVGSLVMYFSATTTQAEGFIRVSWIELPSTAL